jgi:hypothetical protein
MRSSQVTIASDSQCRSHNCPGFNPSILRHSGIRGAADEAVLNIIHKKKFLKKSPFNFNREKDPQSTKIKGRVNFSKLTFSVILNRTIANYGQITLRLRRTKDFKE